MNDFFEKSQEALIQITLVNHQINQLNGHNNMMKYLKSLKFWPETRHEATQLEKCNIEFINILAKSNA